MIWILALLLVGSSDACLKVINIFEIPEGCNCSLPIGIDSNGIKEMSEASQYLANRDTFKPIGFYMQKTKEGCFIMANAAAMPSDVRNFDLMIFSKNGKPVKNRAFSDADDSEKRKDFLVTGLRCFNSHGYWTYHGSAQSFEGAPTMQPPVEGVSLALQSESCGCEPPVASDKYGIRPQITSGRRCDAFQVTCGGTNPALYYTSSTANDVRVDNINWIPNLFSCVAHEGQHAWYYNGIRMDDLEFTCKENDQVKMECGCREPPVTRKLEDYDLTGEFSYYAFAGVYWGGLGVIEFVDSKLTCFMELACSGTLLVFENNNTVSTMPAGDAVVMTYCYSDYIEERVENGTLYFNNAPVDYLAFGCMNMTTLRALKMPSGYSCTLPKAIDVEGIKEMPDGYKFADRDTYDPMFTISEIQNELDGKNYGNSTVIEAACTGRSESTLGYLMIFRTNGLPITAARFYGKGFKKLPIEGLLCPKDGTGSWLYFGGVLENPTFACQEETTCDCPPVSYSDKLGGKPEGTLSDKCLPSNLSCSKGSLYIASSKAHPVRVSSSDLRELVCVKGYGWHYHDVELSDLEFTCDTSDTSGELECPPFKFLDSTEDVEKYDKTGFFADKGQLLEVETNKLGTVYVNPKVTLTQYTCESGIVQFSETGAPWTNSSGVLNLFCGPTSSYHIDGTPVLNVVVACYDENTDRIPMGKCKCPPIWYIDQERVKSTQNSAHLGERETVRPKVKFTEECQIDVSWEHPPADDFYFMIFRENGPPIFNKRFVNSGDGANHFNPYGLHCAQVDEEYQWFYYGGLLQNISFAFQTNADKCKCDTWKGDDTVNSIAAEDGKCDNYRITCSSFAHLAYLSGGNIRGQIILPRRQNNLIEELTCAKVDDQFFWYYGGIKTSVATVSCGSPMFAGESFNAGWSCSCPNFFIIQPTNDYLSVYNKDGSLDSLIAMDANVEYELSITCKPTFTCEPPSNLAFLSTNNAPLIYANGDSPSVECHMTQLGEDTTVSSSFWYVDGILLIEPAFGCLFEDVGEVP